MMQPVAYLTKQFEEIPEEMLETIDFVMSAPRQVYLDGYLLLTNSEARERRRSSAARFERYSHPVDTACGRTRQEQAT
jgi:hypothetical protein